MKKKCFSPPLPPNLKRTNARHLECMVGPSHWQHEICLPKRVHHIWPGLIPLAKNTQPIIQWNLKVICHPKNLCTEPFYCWQGGCSKYITMMSLKPWTPLFLTWSLQLIGQSKETHRSLQCRCMSKFWIQGKCSPNWGFEVWKCHLIMGFFFLFHAY